MLGRYPDEPPQLAKPDLGSSLEVEHSRHRRKLACSRRLNAALVCKEVFDFSITRCHAIRALAKLPRPRLHDRIDLFAKLVEVLDRLFRTRTDARDRCVKIRECARLHDL